VARVVNSRYADFDTITRGRTIDPTNVDFGILASCSRFTVRLARGTCRARRPLAKLRLDAVQLPVFDAGERRGAAVDRVRERFAYDSVHLATTVGSAARRFRSESVISIVPTLIGESDNDACPS
jgi:hypothetical protein